MEAFVQIRLRQDSQAREEERTLIAQFGEEYLASQRTTGMFFPKML